MLQAHSTMVVLGLVAVLCQGDNYYPKYSALKFKMRNLATSLIIHSPLFKERNKFIKILSVI